MKKTLFLVALFLIFSILPNAFSYNEKINILTSWPANKDTFKVTIVNYANLDKDKISIIKNVIESNSQYSKNGQAYFEGWSGALTSLNLGNTKKFEISQSQIPHGDIIIDLLKDEKSAYNGYTIPYYTNNHINAASIEIYNSDKMSSIELEDIVRHEFGHALGLGHSSVKQSAMYETIFEKNLITHCDLLGLDGLYNNFSFTEINC